MVSRPNRWFRGYGAGYNHRFTGNVLERSSVRETAARVAVGALCKVY